MIAELDFTLTFLGLLGTFFPFFVEGPGSLSSSCSSLYKISFWNTWIDELTYLKASQIVLNNSFRVAPMVTASSLSMQLSRRISGTAVSLVSVKQLKPRSLSKRLNPNSNCWSWFLLRWTFVVIPETCKFNHPRKLSSNSLSLWISLGRRTISHDQWMKSHLSFLYLLGVSLSWNSIRYSRNYVFKVTHLQVIH